MSWRNDLKSTALLLIALEVPSTVFAGYTSQCQFAASDLERAARRYEHTKVNYDSACGDGGYRREAVGACGEDGYITASYSEASQRLKQAIRRTYTDCGAPNDTLPLKKEKQANRDLKSKLDDVGSNSARSNGMPHTIQDDTGRQVMDR